MGHALILGSASHGSYRTGTCHSSIRLAVLITQDFVSAIGGQSTALVLSACSGCLEQQGALCKSTSVLLSAELESFVLGEPEFRREGGLLLLSMLCLFTSA